MIDSYLAIANSPLLWVFLIMVVAAFGIMKVTTLEVKPFRFQAGWLRKNYVRLLILVAALLAASAVYLYLFGIGVSLSSVVGRMRLAASDETATPEDLRHLGTTVALLMGVLAAAATIFFSVIRVWINERTATAVEEGLITDRLNKAVEGLGTEKQIYRMSREVSYELDGKRVTLTELENLAAVIPENAVNVDKTPWQNFQISAPNLEVRVGAIYSLKRIAADSIRDYPQIVEILCTYIRQNAPKDKKPSNETVDEVDYFREPHLRVDVQTALTVLGRRTKTQLKHDQQMFAEVNNFPYVFDLRNTNLRGAVLSGLDLSRSFLLGADLRGASLVGTNLKDSSLNFSDCGNANMMFAKLNNTSLVKVNLRGTNACGAQFIGVQLTEIMVDAETTTAGANFSFSGIHNTKLSRNTISPLELTNMYGDASVVYNFGYGYQQAVDSPPHWSTENQAYQEFLTSWAKFKFKRGYSPT